MPNVIKQTDPTAESVDRIIGPTIASVDRVPVKCIVAPLTAGGINAFAFAIQNPEDVDCLIVQLIIDITTAGGTATSVLDVDTVDGATATGKRIMDGLNLNATGTSDSIKNPGTTGGGKPVKWAKKGGTLDDLTGKILVAAASNLVGQVIVKYVPLG